MLSPTSKNVLNFIDNRFHKLRTDTSLKDLIQNFNVEQVKTLRHIIDNKIPRNYTELESLIIETNKVYQSIKHPTKFFKLLFYLVKLLEDNKLYICSNKVNVIPRS